MNKSIMVVGFGLALAAAACGGGDDGGGQKSSTKPATTAAPTDPTQQQTQDQTENKACVVAGDEGNALGVGAYCDKSTHCADGFLCTGDFDPRQSFCTKLCNADPDCGTGATCYHDTRGSACVPNQCLGK